jgi:hypothetical protein
MFRLGFKSVRAHFSKPWSSNRGFFVPRNSLILTLERITDLTVR